MSRKEGDNKDLTPYERIKKWTSKVDLFSKDFLIVPICENLHWYLALICFPHRVLVQETSASTSKAMEETGLSEDGKTKKMDEKEAFEKCIILFFDSLDKRHINTGKILRSFLEEEAKARYPNKQVDFSKLIVQYASVPRQPNYCDCGVFLLHYVEKFFENPEQNYLQLATKAPAMRKWFDIDEIVEKRDKIASLFKQLHLEFKNKHLSTVSWK